MDKEMLKQAAYGPVAGYIASALISKYNSTETIIDQTVELTKAIVDKIYA